MIPLLLLGVQPLWPDAPLAAPFNQGRILAQKGVPASSLPLRVLGRREPASPVDALLPDSRPLGVWSTGSERVIIEAALPLTGESVSRWIGFLAERDRLAADEVEDRWREAGKVLAGRTAVALILSSYPKRSTLSIGEESGPDLSALQVRRIEVVRNGVPEAASHFVCLDIRARERRRVEEAAWWLWTPLTSALASPGDKSVLPPALGDYRRRVVWLEFSGEWREGDRLGIAIVLPKRTKKAEWAPRPTAGPRRAAPARQARG